MPKKQTLTLRECYSILQINVNSSIDEVKRAYRKRAFELHPDLNPNKAKSSSQFQELNEAYVMLIRHLDVQDTKFGNSQNQKNAENRKREASQKEASQKEAREKEAREKEAREEESRRGAARKSAEARSEEARKDELKRESARKEAIRKQAELARKDEAQKDANRKDVFARKEAARHERLELERKAQDIRRQQERDVLTAARREKLRQEAGRQEKARQERREAEEIARKERLLVQERAKQDKLRAKMQAEENINRTVSYTSSARPVTGKTDNTEPSQAEKYKRTYSKPESHSFTESSAESSTKSSTEFSAKPSMDDDFSKEREDLINGLINDDFARRVYEDIYREVEAHKSMKTDFESGTKSKTAEKPSASSHSERAERAERAEHGLQNNPAPQESFGSILKEAFSDVPLIKMVRKPREAVGNVGKGIRGWLRTQIDEEQEFFLPASKLFPGARIRLQIRTGIRKELNTVEITLPPDFLLGRPICLEGMGKRLGKWQGDFYLTFQAK